MEFKFADIGEGITEGEIVEWLVKEKDVVKTDQVLCKIETDKSVVEMPSPVNGVIKSINVKSGKVKVGDILVVIDTKEKVKKKESTSVIGDVEVARESPKKTKEKINLLGNPSEKERSINSRQVKALPSVKKLAKEKGIDLALISGTGPRGMISKKDVLLASNKVSEKIETKVSNLPSGSNKPKVVKKYDLFGHVRHIPLTGVRKITAENMVQSWTSTPHVTHFDEFEVTKLYKLREKEKNFANKKKVHLTFMPFIIKAIVSGLKEYPELASEFIGDEIIQKQYFNIGVAIDKGNGLFVPVIKGAELKSIIDIAKEIQDFSKKVEERTLSNMDMKGGVFTITNVGSVGGIFATPIIKPGECAILALGRIYDKALVVNGKVQVRKVLPISLAFDHRVLDGALAARFATYVGSLLTNPGDLMLE